MRIGKLAERSGVSVRALRYYEEQGLLEAERTPGGQRSYPEAAVDRVRFVQQLYAAGVPSRVIVTLLPCIHTGVATPEMIDRLMTERQRIVARIAELDLARTRLDGVIEHALTISGAEEPVVSAVGA